jgi:hypothetical protein
MLTPPVHARAPRLSRGLALWLLARLTLCYVRLAAASFTLRD